MNRSGEIVWKRGRVKIKGVGLIIKIGSRNDRVGEKMVKAFPDIAIQVSKSEDSNYTVNEAKPDCMEVIGDDTWVLRLPEKSYFKWLYTDERGPLFVRKCDRDMCEKVIFPTILQCSDSNRGNFITGTPRMGKSVFTNWVVAMIRSYFKDKDIYIYDAQYRDRSLIKSNGRCYEIEQKQYEYGVRNDKNAITLIDTGCDQKIPTFRHAGYTMVTASSKAMPKAMDNEMNRSTAYLTVWSFSDVIAEANLLFSIGKLPRCKGKDAIFSRLKYSYTFAGGVPGILFIDSDEVNFYDDCVELSIKRAKLDRWPYLSLGDEQHKVLHIHAKDNLYDYKLKFASEYVEKKIHEPLRMSDFDRLQPIFSLMIEDNSQKSTLQASLEY